MFFHRHSTAAVLLTALVIGAAPHARAEIKPEDQERFLRLLRERGVRVPEKPKPKPLSAWERNPLSARYDCFAVVPSMRLCTDADVEQRFLWPLVFVEKPTFGDLANGSVNGRFGLRANPTDPSRPQFHGGIDLFAPAGSMVVAIMDGGRVTAATGRDKGGQVRIDYRYKESGAWKHLVVECNHLDPVTVDVGQRMAAGYQIGKVGAGIVGHSTAPHLDIRMSFTDERADGTPGPDRWVDPTSLSYAVLVFKTGDGFGIGGP